MSMSSAKRGSVATETATSPLHAVYLQYTKNAKDMDNKTFVKLLKDTKVIDKKYTTTDADLLFAKIKSDRKIYFNNFEQSLQAIATKKNVSEDKIKGMILKSNGPVLTGTKTEDVRFHDDKTTYTGVHKEGGPTTLDTGRSGFSNLSEICDRSSANVRGINKNVASKSGSMKN